VVLLQFFTGNLAQHREVTSFKGFAHWVAAHVHPQEKAIDSKINFRCSSSS
jgi:hypothetical protein